MTRKESILKAATELFAGKGYDGTSTAEVAERAGVAHGTLFHHFGTKENLFIEMLNAFVEEFSSGLEGLKLEEGTGWEALERSLRYNLDFLRTHDREVFMLISEHYRVAKDSACFAHHDLIHKGMENIQAIRRNLLERGQKDGSIRPLPIEDTMFVMECVLTGIVNLRAKGTENFPENVTEVMIDFYRRTLCTKE